MSRRKVPSARAGRVAAACANARWGRAPRATASPTRAPIRVWVTLSSCGQSRLQARIHPVGVGFENAGLVLTRECRGINVALGIIVVLAGGRIDAADCAHHFRTE